MTTIPTFEIVDGIANAIPPTNNTLHITNKITFVVKPIKIRETILTINEPTITCLTPVRSLIRPANNESNIPIIPKSLALMAVASEPPTISEVI